MVKKKTETINRRRILQKTILGRTIQGREMKPLHERVKSCIHYSGVEDGFYCWKCMQKLEAETRKDIYDTLDLVFAFNEKCQACRINEKWYKK